MWLAISDVIYAMEMMLEVVMKMEVNKVFDEVADVEVDNI